MNLKLYGHILKTSSCIEDGCKKGKFQIIKHVSRRSYLTSEGEQEKGKMNGRESKYTDQLVPIIPP